MSLIAERNFAEIVSMSKGIRLNEQQIASAIDEYGRAILPLPDEALQYIDIIEVKYSQPKRWSVVVPFWTREEGCSDLSMELTVFIAKGNKLGFEIDNIHVL